jgi:hypothetical protein
MFEGFHGTEPLKLQHLLNRCIRNLSPQP